LLHKVKGMPESLEERIAYLEGRVEEHNRGFGDLTRRIDALDQKVDRFRLELSARIDALDQKIDRLRAELFATREELSARIDHLSRRIDVLDHKQSQQFIWLVGIQIAVLLAVIGALLR
jgi:chromosome segregation ATPase